MNYTKDDIRRGMLLYAVTDQSWLKEGQTLLSVCKDVLANGASFLQIREKDLDADSFEAEAARLKELCAKHKVPFVVNDSVEIALAIDADGVHVGQSDIQGRDIRSLIGQDKILGISAGTGLYRCGRSVWNQHEKERPESDGGKAERNQQSCIHSCGCHRRHQCKESDGIVRKRCGWRCGGVCNFCSRRSR